MSDTTSRRHVLRTAALAGAALAPGTIARAEAAAGPREPFDARAFGATGDGKTDDTAALQRAIRAAHEAGGGTAQVPAGTYVCRPIEILSNVTLHLEAGATILGSPRLEDYPVEGRDASGESERSGLVTARGASRVAIVGRGTIDGNALAFHDATKPHDSGDFDRGLTRQGAAFMPKGVLFEHGPIAHGERPGNLVRFFECRDVLVHGVTIRNSPTWTSHYRRCRNVTIESIRIDSEASGNRVPNDDGIDLVECDDVRILGCDIDTGDDCIALFGSQRVVVTNCTLRTRSVAIRCGYDHVRAIRDCVFSSLVISEANRGLGVFVRGAGDVENLLFTDITMRTRLLTGHWWGKGEPVHVSAILWAPGVEKPGRIRNVTFARLRVEGEHGIVLWGSPESTIEDLSFEDVRMTLRRGPHSDAWGGNLDLRLTRDPRQALFAHDIPAVLARHVDGLALRGLDVRWGGDPPAFFSHAIDCEEFREVAIERFRGRQAQVSGSAIRLRRGVDAVVERGRATAGCDTFCEASEVTGRVLVSNNDTRAARLERPVEGPAK